MTCDFWPIEIILKTANPSLSPLLRKTQKKTSKRYIGYDFCTHFLAQTIHMHIYICARVYVHSTIYIKIQTHVLKKLKVDSGKFRYR